MRELKAKVGEWWVCDLISIMGNGDCQSAYKMNAGLIVAGNVKPIERLYTQKDCDRLQQENTELREALVLISLNSSFQANMPHEADLIENLLNKND
ncbi:coil containing protein [Vibrio phage 1.177.O._10N.286.45.E10]|nr:coil containing protein [Vibrio phage 1.177.O._10N.286.45.E10]